MGNKTIIVAEATAAQLRDFGALAFGMDLSGRENVNQMIAKLKLVGFTGEQFAVEDDTSADDQSEKVHVPLGESVVGGKKMIRVNINISEKSGGDQAVPLSVNGVAMIVERGVDSDIPEPYFEVLQNAKQSIPITDRDGHITGYRNKYAYPFSRVA